MDLRGLVYQIPSIVLGSNTLLIVGIVVLVVAVVTIFVLRRNKLRVPKPAIKTETPTLAASKQLQAFCWHCGSKISPASIFCDVCGHAQQQPSTRPLRINSLLGMTVTDASGKVVGSVSDVELSEGRAYLIIKPIQSPGAQEGAPDMTVRWDQIASIQDIIILKTHVESKPQTCSCGNENPPGSKFCRNCGRILD